MLHFRVPHVKNHICLAFYEQPFHASPRFDTMISLSEFITRLNYFIDFYLSTQVGLFDMPTLFMPSELLLVKKADLFE